MRRTSDKWAARSLDAKVGDQLRLLASNEPVSVKVKGVLKDRSLLADGPPTLIVPLERAQTWFGRPGQINSIVVSNRGDERAGDELSEEVTRELRVLFSDREVASRLKELLNQEEVDKALKRRQKSLAGPQKEDISRLRAELQREGVSDELISLLSNQNVLFLVGESLERDGLNELANEADAVYPGLSEFQVFNEKRHFDWQSNWWSSFAIAFGSIGVLSVGAWGVFQRKEL